MEQKTEASQAVKFSKKPVEIEAIQWTGANLVSIIEFTDGRKPDNRHDFAAMKWDEYTELVKRDGLKIFTLEGKMNADVGDWIIKGVKGEFYPCKPDIFELTYERAALKAQPARTEAQGDAIKARVKELQKQGLQLHDDVVLQQLSGNSGELAQGEDSARLDWLIENVSSGSIGFINGDFIGSQDFDELKVYIDRARASAETGGVKP